MKTSVVRSFGADVSLTCLNDMRMVQQFEKKSDARKRSLQDHDDVKTGKKKPRNPIGNLEKYQWRSQECLEYVNSLPYGANINFTDLARKI